MILIRNIKTFQPINFALMIIIAIVSWVKIIISKDVTGLYYDSDTLLIYNWIYNHLDSDGLCLICKLIAFLFVVIQAILINAITNQYNLIGFRSYLPGLIYIILIANFTPLQQLHPILFANIFLLLSWERYASVSDNSNTLKSFFQSAFFLGIACLFYPNYIYFLVVIILSTSINRVSDLKEFVIILLGFLIVWYFYFGITFLSSESIILDGLDANFSFSFTGFSVLSKFTLGFLFFLGFLFLIANLQLSNFLTGVKISIRRNFKLLFTWFFIAISIFIFTKSSIEIIYPLAVPSSILFTVLFANINNKWISETIWLIFLGFTIINQIYA